MDMQTLKCFSYYQYSIFGTGGRFCLSDTLLLPRSFFYCVALSYTRNKVEVQIFGYMNE